MNDEERAETYRQQLLARVRYKRAREAALRGDSAAARAVYAMWEPVLSGQDIPLVWEDV